ncbi:MAG: hypothetical protein AAF610_06150 [Pseudomonadota bacterium]
MTSDLIGRPPALRGRMTYQFAGDAVALSIEHLRLGKQDRALTVAFTASAAAQGGETGRTLAAWVAPTCAAQSNPERCEHHHVLFEGAFAAPPPGIYYLHVQLRDCPMAECVVHEATFPSRRKF